MSQQFRGVFANLPTGFDDTGAQGFDEQRQRAIVRHVVDGGAHGIACLLTSGEFLMMSVEERMAATEVIVDEVAGRIPVVVGVSAFRTSEMLTLAKHAAGAGASAVMILPLVYFPLTDDEIVSVFSDVYDVTELPMGLYDGRMFAQPALNVGLIGRLAEVANLQLTKNGTQDVARIGLINDVTGGRVSVLDGGFDLSLAALVSGAGGLCAAFASVWPTELAEVYELVQAGEFAKAKARFGRVAPAMRFFRDHSNLRSLKAAAALRGVSVGNCRAPIGSLNDEELAALGGLVDELSSDSES